MYKATVLVHENKLGNIETICACRDIPIVSKTFKKAGGDWFKKDSWELTIIMNSLCLADIEALKRENQYQGLDVIGLDGKDKGLHYPFY
jgi:hypothetical protein